MDEHEEHFLGDRFDIDVEPSPVTLGQSLSVWLRVDGQLAPGAAPLIEVPIIEVLDESDEVVRSVYSDSSSNGQGFVARVETEGLQPGVYVVRARRKDYALAQCSVEAAHEKDVEKVAHFRQALTLELAAETMPDLHSYHESVLRAAALYAQAAQVEAAIHAHIKAADRLKGYADALARKHAHGASALCSSLDSSAESKRLRARALEVCARCTGSVRLAEEASAIYRSLESLSSELRSIQLCYELAPDSQERVQYCAAAVDRTLGSSDAAVIKRGTAFLDASARESLRSDPSPMLSRQADSGEVSEREYVLKVSQLASPAIGDSAPSSEFPPWANDLGALWGTYITSLARHMVERLPESSDADVYVSVHAESHKQHVRIALATGRPMEPISRREPFDEIARILGGSVQFQPNAAAVQIDLFP